MLDTVMGKPSKVLYMYHMGRAALSFSQEVK